MAEREDGLLHSRQNKLNRLRERGIDPYPPRFRRTTDAATAIAEFAAAEAAAGDSATEPQGPEHSLAGRITAIRVMGRAAFLDLRDGSGTVQAMLRQNVLGDGYDLLKDLDLGDFLGVSGPMLRTRTGQISIAAHSLTLLAKGMRPLPEKWHGLRDVEIRYRQRYLDLIADPEGMTAFAQRSRVISGIRRFLDGRGFLEVDTPILVPVAAGAHARPFATHHNALNQRLYLRIATELYLKRLIVGGLDKVYELGRVFRNEGIDQDHNPEFTLLESYEAYADYKDVMTMVEQMISSVAQEVRGTMKIPYGDKIINFTPTPQWPRLSLKDELYRRCGIDLDAYPPDADAAFVKAVANLIPEASPRESRGRLIDKLVSTYIEPQLIQPTFLLDYPAVMSPLAKEKPEQPGYVERFEAFAAGMEIANSYTELNDPAAQRARFEEQENIRQLFRDEEVDRLDEDFLTALEYGMPPTGGLGVGIDRLAMLLTGQSSIRDVLLFPQMRAIPSGGGGLDGREDNLLKFAEWFDHPKRLRILEPTRAFVQWSRTRQRAGSVMEFSRWLDLPEHNRLPPVNAYNDWIQQIGARHRSYAYEFAHWLERADRNWERAAEAAEYYVQYEFAPLERLQNVRDFAFWLEMPENENSRWHPRAAAEHYIQGVLRR